MSRRRDLEDLKDMAVIWLCYKHRNHPKYEVTLKNASKAIMATARYLGVRTPEEGRPYMDMVRHVMQLTTYRLANQL